jgi:hypothetical protein
MAEYKDREHYIPLRRHELVDMLCADRDLAYEEREQFRHFCRLMRATFHCKAIQLLDKLKEAYAPFDPDSIAKPVQKLTADDKQKKLNDLFTQFNTLMDQADYKHLCSEDMDPVIGHHSYWGLRMDVDFKAFERLAVYIRGDHTEKRSLRRASGMWQKEQLALPVHRRVVMILKLRPHKRLGHHADTEHVFIQIFKDIPKQDLMMLLPGARVRMTRLDRGKIGFPLLSGAALAVWNIVKDVGEHIGEFVSQHWAEPASLWALTTGAIGYGIRSYYGYSQTKQRYHLNLTQVLYYQNLDTNAGVLFRLLDEGEEQQCSEAILAYYFLWRYAGEKGWLAGDLDDYVELDLERRLNVKIDFEINDALAKLQRLRIVEKVGERYRAQPLDKALQMLDYTWDNYFKINNPEPEEPPIPDQKAAV